MVLRDSNLSYEIPIPQGGVFHRSVLDWLSVQDPQIGLRVSLSLSSFPKSSVNCPVHSHHRGKYLIPLWLSLCQLFQCADGWLRFENRNLDRVVDPITLWLVIGCVLPTLIWDRWVITHQSVSPPVLWLPKPHIISFWASVRERSGGGRCIVYWFIVTK